jgi:hypothetical protein
MPDAGRLVRIEQVHQNGPSNVTGATFTGSNGPRT